MSLGRYPEISLADARERRDAARKQLAHGVDPMAERMAKKAVAIAATEHSFEKIGEFWLEHWRGNKSARHAATTQNRSRNNRLTLECCIAMLYSMIDADCAQN
jgi:hypothetical protein